MKALFGGWIVRILRFFAFEPVEIEAGESYVHDFLDLLTPRAEHLAFEVWGENIALCEGNVMPWGVYPTPDGMIFLGPQSTVIVKRAKLREWFDENRFRLMDDAFRTAAHTANREMVDG